MPLVQQFTSETWGLFMEMNYLKQSYVRNTPLKVTFVQRNLGFSCSKTSLPKVSACQSDNGTWNSKCFWLSARYFEMPAANTSLHDMLFPLTPLEQSISLSVKFLLTWRSEVKCIIHKDICGQLLGIFALASLSC